MTIEQFGQQIKTKYPQYQDVSDAELGQKMLSKYPQYQDMITADADTPIPENVEKVDAFLQGHGTLKTISDLVGTTGLGKGIAQGIFLRFTPEGKDLIKQVAEGKLKQEEVENIIGKTATTKEILGSAAQTATTIATAGLKSATAKTVLGRTFQTGTKIGSLSAISSGAGTFGEGGTAEEIRESALLGGGIGFGIGALAQFIPERIAKLALRGDAKAGQTALATRKWGTRSHMQSQSKGAQKILSGQIKKTLASEPLSQVKFNQEADIFSKIAARMNARGADETATSVKNTVYKAARNSRGLLAQKELNITQTNQLRENLDSLLQDKAFQKKFFDLPQTKQILLETANTTRNLVKDTADRTLGNNQVSKAFSELTKEIKFSQALEKAYKPTFGLNTQNILNAALGPIGGGIGGGVVGFQQGGLEGAVKGVGVGAAAGTLAKPAGLINVAKFTRGAGKLGGIATKNIPGVVESNDNQQ